MIEFLTLLMVLETDYKGAKTDIDYGILYSLFVQNFLTKNSLMIWQYALLGKGESEVYKCPRIILLFYVTRPV